jgi:trk system potassium uptake protein TrkA
VAVTKFDNKNLMAAEVAGQVFGVPHVMARLFNPDKEVTYQALGMRYVCGTRMVAQAMLERMLGQLVSVKTSCLFNRYDLVEFRCPRSWNNHTVREVQEQSRLNIAHVTKGSTGYLPEDNFKLLTGQVVTALATAEGLEWLEKYLRKNKRGEDDSHRD